MSALPRRALVAGLYAAVATGSFYAFGLYSDALQEQFDLSPADLTNINTIPSAFGVFSTAIAAAGRRLGNRLSLAAGGLLIASMQLLMYCVANKLILVPNPPLTLVVFTVLISFGCSLIASVAFSAPILHFPKMRGRAIALVKSFVGLGGEVVAQLFVLCYGSKKSDPTSFNALILWAVISVGCTILAASVVPTARDVNSLEPHGLLRLIFWELFVLGFFSVGIAFLPDGMLHNALVVVMVLLALAPIALAVFTPDDKPPHAAASCGTDSLEACAHAEGGQRTPGVSDGRAVPSSPSASSHAVPAGQPLLSLRQEGCRTECLTGYHRSLDGHPQHTDDADVDLRSDADIFETTTPRMLFPMLATPEAWLILLTGAVVVGGGNLIATSISQIVSACGGHHDLVPRAVTVFSAGNQLGRLVCTLLSDKVVRAGLPRPLFVALIAGLMVVSHLLFSAAAYLVVHGSVLQVVLISVACFAGGLSFGAMWPHLVLLSSEIFGSKNLSVNYMFLDGSCAAFGTLVFANFLPRLYNRAPPGAEKCVGSGCFGPTHLIVACLGLLGVLSAILTARSSALLYQKIGHSMRMS